MSPYDQSRKAVALQYENGSPAPVVVASGMGYLAEKIVEVAAENGVCRSMRILLWRPCFPNSSLDRKIPESLYRFIVISMYIFYILIPTIRRNSVFPPPRQKRSKSHDSSCTTR